MGQLYWNFGSQIKSELWIEISTYDMRVNVRP